MTWNARYHDTVWIGQSPALDDVDAATGLMQVVGVEDEVRHSASCREVAISIKGMKPLIEGFVK